MIFFDTRDGGIKMIQTRSSCGLKHWTWEIPRGRNNHRTEAFFEATHMRTSNNVVSCNQQDGDSTSLPVWDQHEDNSSMYIHNISILPSKNLWMVVAFIIVLDDYDDSWRPTTANKQRPSQTCAHMVYFRCYPRYRKHRPRASQTVGPSSCSPLPLQVIFFVTEASPSAQSEVGELLVLPVVAFGCLLPLGRLLCCLAQAEW